MNRVPDDGPVESPRGITSEYVRRIADRTPSLLAYWGSDLRCRFANRAYSIWFGVDPDQMIGARIDELLGPALFALNWPYISKALQGEEQRFERVVPGKDGVQRHSLAHYIPDVVNARVEGFVVEVTETTPLKAAEAALRASEHRFKALVTSLPLGVYEIDAAGHRVFTNARWRAIYGVDGLAASGSDDWVETLHEDDRAAVLKARERSFLHRVPFDMEFRIRRRDGAIRTVHSLGQPLWNDDGSPAGFVGAADDVTERRNAESRLRSSELLLERTGRLAGVGGWEADLRSGEVIWSEQTRTIHEVAPAYRPTLQAAVAFFAPEARPVIQAAIDAAIASGTPWDLELPFISATGRSLWVRSLGEVEFEQGVPVRLTGAFKDVSQRREQESKLLVEREARTRSERHALELDRLLAERSEILEVLAHEVRQPLNNASAALQSAAAVLKRSGDAPASEPLARARAVLGTVLASIDNTLAVASLLARSESIHRVDTDVDVLLRLTVADMPAEAQARVSIERPPGISTAPLDLGLMRLALGNLLRNALRYSASDRPVTVRLCDVDEPLALAIDVSDHGPGLAPGSVPTLFDRSKQRQAHARQDPHGFGLGLYIVKRVMDLHGGQVALTRNGTDGATLRLLLPLVPDEG